jgi:hypothetical protein
MGVADTGTLHHICWVVNDLDKRAEKLADSLSLSWNVWTIEPETCLVHGEEVPFSFRVAIAPVGDSNFELIEPHTGDSIYVEHLNSKGEGFHHTCVIYDTLEAMRAAKDELLGQGREMVQFGGLGEVGEFGYFATPEIDALLEGLYLKELPQPEKTIG